MRWRALVISLTGLSLLMGFQNCGAPSAMDAGPVNDSDLREKVSLSGRYLAVDYIAFSGCPDIDVDGKFACTMQYTETHRKTIQTIDFMPDGTLMVEGACNTYYSTYEMYALSDDSSASGQIKIGALSGTNNPCSGDEVEEESLLIHRLSKAIKISEEGPDRLTITTSQSAAIRFAKDEISFPL